ncbi:orotate phosphoribosyltransferase [Ichthyobacterium seriolicida]|uniref:Orotate phosphoribosyltransferase n=2 Tax=Ichthyobacterium seriolicida TaxID=242600 RepID=A0A1J1DXT6_9FLAO|nr:orotate phosphoribosyltransferase [Ichthyobacterium seriolicida]
MDIKSPMYCDNRLILSDVNSREQIKRFIVEVVKEKFTNIDIIAGVATGAIAMGVLVAQELGLPFVYVRSEQKKHGTKNQIEGSLPKGARVLVVEDLISSGTSSLNAVRALKDVGSKVLGVMAVFSYGFKISKDNFSAENCELLTLTNCDIVLKRAIQKKYIIGEDIEKIKKWKDSCSK